MDEAARTHSSAYAELKADNERLKAALRESLKLQSHYASLLNAYDGGQRKQFSGPAEWIERLIETGTIRR